MKNIIVNIFLIQTMLQLKSVSLPHKIFMRNFFLYLLGFFILIIPEILTVYWIMPFPGSQQNVVVERAYFVNKYIWFFRIAGILIISFPAYYYIFNANGLKKLAPFSRLFYMHSYFISLITLQKPIKCSGNLKRNSLRI